MADRRHESPPPYPPKKRKLSESKMKSVEKEGRNRERGHHQKTKAAVNKCKVHTAK
jgi:hypothetical protein